MSAIFKHEGKCIDFVPAADVVAGDVVVQADLVAVAKLDIKAGTLGSLAVEGVFDISKAAGAGTALAIGLAAQIGAPSRMALKAPPLAINRVGSASSIATAPRELASRGFWSTRAMKIRDGEGSKRS